MPKPYAIMLIKPIVVLNKHILTQYNVYFVGTYVGTYSETAIYTENHVQWYHIQAFLA